VVNKSHIKRGVDMRGKLKSLRKEQKLTQESLSNMVNIHRTYYSMIENGRRNPSLKVAVSIKKALNYQYDDIFEKQ
jgi:putative transcriptional regulator